MIRGRHGDVAFVFVIVVTLAAVLVTGMVLVTSTREVSGAASRFAHVSGDALVAERYAVAASSMLGSLVIRAGSENETLGERFVAAAEQGSLLAQSQGFYERVIAPGAVVFEATSAGYELAIRGIPVTVVEGGNRLQRVVSIKAMFDGAGRVHKIYKEYGA